RDPFVFETLFQNMKQERRGNYLTDRREFSRAALAKLSYFFTHPLLHIPPPSSIPLNECRGASPIGAI
ncbi:hypothetical protein, partial [Pseudodesulfovibrio sp. JC047]|uniref:hypothetical protein n=1 Tax=Pseudodesulfovibrio sp. JC047 TaxID=2683199 RepID=UPI00193F85FD